MWPFWLVAGLTSGRICLWPVWLRFNWTQVRFEFPYHSMMKCWMSLFITKFALSVTWVFFLRIKIEKLTIYLFIHDSRRTYRILSGITDNITLRCTYACNLEVDKIDQIHKEGMVGIYCLHYSMSFVNMK